MSADTGRDDPDCLARTARMAAGAYLRGHAGDYDEILSDAMLGCAQAHARWRPDGGASLGTYAYRRAQGAILDGVRDRAPIGRGAWARGVRELPEHQRPPLTLDAEQDGVPLLVSLPCRRAPLDLLAVEDRDELERLLALIPRREAWVVQAHDLEGVLLREIGAALGVSECRVSQIRASGIQALRRAARRQVDLSPA